MKTAKQICEGQIDEILLAIQEDIDITAKHGRNEIVYSTYRSFFDSGMKGIGILYVKNKDKIIDSLKLLGFKVKEINFEKSHYEYKHGKHFWSKRIKTEIIKTYTEIKIEWCCGDDK